MSQKQRKRNVRTPDMADISFCGFFADMSCCGHLYMRFLRTYLVADICFFCADISCSDISVYVFADIIFFCIVGISCARITLCVFLKTQVIL